MGSKSIFLLCLFLAISTLLVISEVAARDLTETSEKKTDGEIDLNDAKYGVNGGYGPGKGGYGPGKGGYGPADRENGLNDAKYGGNAPAGIGGNAPGIGGSAPGIGGNAPGIGGIGGNAPGGKQGRYCRHGCCRRVKYRRGCKMCCRYAGEKAVTVQPHN